MPRLHPKPKCRSFSGLLLAASLLALMSCTPAIRFQQPLAAPWQASGYVSGNAVEVLSDGPNTYRSMYAAIAAARHHIHLQTYIFCDDEVGRELTSRLAERSKAGVAVRVMYDSHGSTPCTSPHFFEHLRQHGVELVALRPPLGGGLIRPFYYHRRDHRKLLVVDGRVAFTGGINFNDVYADSPRFADTRDGGWRDTNVRVEGPAVAGFQALFLRRWRMHRPLPDFPGDAYFPSLAAAGDAAVRIVSSRSGSAPNEIYRDYLGAIRHARKRIWLTHSYFMPEPNLMQVLTDAAERGVDVRLLLPGFSDVPLLHPIAESTYERLLSAGVRIYERSDVFVHAKTAVVDGHWSTVGSSNLDYRSFVHNDEVNAMIIDAGVARRLEALFMDDLAHAEEVRLEVWRERPLHQRLVEWLSLTMAYWL